MEKLEPQSPSNLLSNFSAGDLLYGIDKVSEWQERFGHHRNKYIQEIEEWYTNLEYPHWTQEFETLGVITADRIHRYFTPFNSDYIDRHIKYIVINEEGYEEEEIHIPNNELLIVYKYREWLSRQTNFPKLLTPHNDRDENLKRSCKALIKYTVERDSKVHFILDEINTVRVVSKLALISKGTKYGPFEEEPEENLGRPSYTNSELRYIYRNYNNQAFRNNVIFYLNDQVVRPPWERPEANLWRKYH